MPTYVYKFVKTGETIEIQQAFTDDTLTEYTHPKSGDVVPVKKVFQPVGVTFKGSGFFKTDNRGSKATTPPGSSDSSGSSGSDSGSSSSKESGKESGKDSGKDSGSSSAKESSSSGSTASPKKSAGEKTSSAPKKSSNSSD